MILLGELLLLSPATAGAGKTFDFNATLPLTVLEFLFLMLFLDKTWYGPGGKVIDQRSAKIAASLLAEKEGGSGSKNMGKEAENILEEARCEVRTYVENSLSISRSENDSKLRSERDKLENLLANTV